MSDRKCLTNIYYQALNAVKAEAVVSKNISLDSKNLMLCKKRYPLKSIGNLYCFSVGKAGLEMAKVCENILGNLIKEGVAISHQKGKLSILKHYGSTHPLVSQKSLESAQKLIESIEQMKKNDFFIFFLSGGASAMIEKPIEGLSLEEFQKISSALLGTGIDIKALNSVRKAISEIKGGKLANHTKAKGVVLVLSDVIGDDLQTIGSAPMNNGKIPHYIIGNNTIALKQAKRYIQPKVEKVKIVTTTLNLPSEDATEYIVKKVKKYDKDYDSFCLLFGGETTTEVKGTGSGGRNQELALRLLDNDILGSKISILVAGSDGIDGNSPATGAFVDIEVMQKLKELGLNPKSYLKNSDSYSFFKALDADFTIGATGTNVMDFIIVLKK